MLPLCLQNDPVCVICLDGEVYDNNGIIFCDKCNVAVHQFCYHIDDVPADAWYVIFLFAVLFLVAISEYHIILVLTGIAVRVLSMLIQLH